MAWGAVFRASLGRRARAGRGPNLGDRAALALGAPRDAPLLMTDRASVGAVPSVEVVLVR